ncbi:MAG: diacylglycerol/lipid kinase family protein [Gulosibacter sp.]|uniref:diacylglycerol/lipid kinase family protein n=1 Tax=Gulosibacter sp. TaxID=2817531 RepID=UPI003F922474
MRAERIVYALNATSGQGFNGGSSDFGEGVELATGETFAELEAATATALERPADALIVQGGDGMVSMGAAFAAVRGIPLGVVPTGTGNDFARSVGIPRGRTAHVRERLIEGLRDGSARFRAVDLLRYTVDGEKHVAVNSINIGFDALVNERANEMRHLSGTSRYLIALIQSIRHFESATFKYAIDDDAQETIDAQVFTIMNGRSAGGGIPLVPAARPDDGELDVLSVSRLNRVGLLLLFPTAFARLHPRLPQVEIQHGTTVRVDIPAGVPIYADGECVRASTSVSSASVEIRLDPAALRLVRSVTH